MFAKLRLQLAKATVRSHCNDLVPNNSIVDHNWNEREGSWYESIAIQSFCNCLFLVFCDGKLATWVENGTKANESQLEELQETADAVRARVNYLWPAH